MDYVKCLAVNDNELGLKPEQDIHAGYTIVPLAWYWEGKHFVIIAIKYI